MASEDQVLFGDTNAKIANEFCDRVEAALVEGVASLPLMSERSTGEPEDSITNTTKSTKSDTAEQPYLSRDQKMLQKLRKAYIRNVDIVEIYAGRNIFSVSNRTPHFRKRVVEAFEKSQNVKSATETTTARKSGTRSETVVEISNNADQASSRMNVKTQQDIPSNAMITAMEEDMKSLRIKLEQARKLQQERFNYCHKLDQAAAFAKTTQTSLKEVAVEKLPKAVESLVQAQQSFTELQDKGSNLLHTMDAEKCANKNIQNDEDKVDLAPAVQQENTTKKRKTTMTIEEQYREHRSALAETQTRDILAVRDMLKQKKV